MIDNKNLKIALFGTPSFAVQVFDELHKNGITPQLVVTQPDKPAGRRLVLTPPPVKNWAIEQGINLEQPSKLDDEFISLLKKQDWDLFIVAAYGLIIPQSVLDIPKHGTLNIHPSLLPRHRGATPLQQAILDDNETGVTIMVMDAKMDHGDILVQEKTEVPGWPPSLPELDSITALQGARLIIENLEGYLTGTSKVVPQDHDKATFTTKITKKDGLIDLTKPAEENFRKIQAYANWPRTYFFKERNGKEIRVIITSAKLTNGELEILRVVPEGKKEMDYYDFVYR